MLLLPSGTESGVGIWFDTQSSLFSLSQRDMLWLAYIHSPKRSNTTQIYCKYLQRTVSPQWILYNMGRISPIPWKVYFHLNSFLQCPMNTNYICSFPSRWFVPFSLTFQKKSSCFLSALIWSYYRLPHDVSKKWLVFIALYSAVRSSTIQFKCKVTRKYVDEGKSDRICCFSLNLSQIGH